MTAADRPAGARSVIRPATVEDAEAMGEVAGRSWEETYRGMIPDAVLDEWLAEVGASWRKALESRPADSPARAWLAELEGRVVGYATTSPGRDQFAEPPAGSGELTNLYLDPDVVGSGLGRSLYEVAVADLAERGFEPLVVWAFRNNARARGFYERMGLTVDIDDATWELGGVACPIVRFVAPLSPAAGQ